MTALIALLGSSAFGSLLGGLFALFNRKADIESKKLDQLHEQAKWSHELQVQDKAIELANAEAQGKKDVAIIEGDARVEAARVTAIAAAQAADKITADELAAAGWWRWLLVIVSALNRAVRPVATVVLTGAALNVSLMLMQKLSVSWGLLQPAQQLDTAMQAYAWVVGQASAALGYWFVARGSSKR